MAKSQFLTKEQELQLGAVVQEMVKAKEILSVLATKDITRQQLNTLNKTIAEGEQAVETLIEHNTGLVYSIARNFKSKYPGAPALEDLFQEGMAGLITAIYRYDPSRNNKLSTVATPWIFQGITRWTNKTGRLVKLPENRVSDYGRISKLRASLENTGLTKAEIDEAVMEELNLSKDDLFFINGAASTHASLNKVVDEESSKELIEIVFDDVQNSAESVVLGEATFQILVDSISELNDLEKEVVISHFNLDIPGCTTDSVKNVRDKYDLSAAKFKKILTESLEEINQDMKELDLSFQDFLQD